MKTGYIIINPLNALPYGVFGNRAEAGRFAIARNHEDDTHPAYMLYEIDGSYMRFVGKLHRDYDKPYDEDTCWL